MAEGDLLGIHTSVVGVKSSAFSPGKCTEGPKFVQFQGFLTKSLVFSCTLTLFLFQGFPGVKEVGQVTDEGRWGLLVP